MDRPDPSAGGTPHEGGGGEGRPPQVQREFKGRVWSAVGIAALAAALGLLVAFHATIPLMAFAGLLFAVALDAAAAPLHRRLGLPRALSVCLVTLAILGLATAGAWLWGPIVAQQGGDLLERVPDTINRVERLLRRQEWSRGLLSDAEDAWDIERVTSALGQVWKPLTSAFTSTFAVLTGALVVAIFGFFLALDPGLYRRGLLHLTWPDRRDLCDEALGTIGHALRWWLLGRLASMGVVGVLTVTGLTLLGAPLAFFLGFVAAALSFIPFLGPVLSAIPALLVAAAEDPKLALWVLLLYAGIQFVESNFLTPLIQARAVSLPPAVLVLAQVLMGGLFGPLGVLVATPLTVAAIVAVQVLHVRDVLGDRVRPMGRHH